MYGGSVGLTALTMASTRPLSTPLNDTVTWACTTGWASYRRSSVGCSGGDTSSMQAGPAPRSAPHAQSPHAVPLRVFPRVLHPASHPYLGLPFTGHNHPSKAPPKPHPTVALPPTTMCPARGHTPPDPGPTHPARGPQQVGHMGHTIACPWLPSLHGAPAPSVLPQAPSHASCLLPLPAPGARPAAPAPSAWCAAAQSARWCPPCSRPRPGVKRKGWQWVRTSSLQQLRAWEETTGFRADGTPSDQAWSSTPASNLGATPSQPDGDGGAECRATVAALMRIFYGRTTQSTQRILALRLMSARDPGAAVSVHFAARVL